MIRLSGLRAVVLDIEGTTCPVDFVAGTLFPYAHRHLEAHLAKHGGDPAMAPLLQEIWQGWADETDPAAPPLPAAEARQALAAVPYLQWLISRDRKFTPLKDLQGQIWAAGYHHGELRTPLFEDVAPALQRWAALGLRLAVYSSGSVQAQQLFYGHTAAGDLQPLFSAWYDTRLGPKREAASYRALLEDLQLPAAAVLFISDSAGELEAATSAGLQVCGSQRPGNPETLSPHWLQVQHFGELTVTAGAV
ncbi:MAG: acireductone synthase [Synechococcus sp.]|nr:acireductone synthase [Synechococcus sp.]